MNKSDRTNREEINFGELLAAIYAHKFLITTIISISLLLVAYYLSKKQDLFKAEAIFQIESQDNPGFMLPEDFGALSALIGLGGSASSDKDILIERIESREFILKVSATTGMNKDEFFNPEIEITSDPSWKRMIKKLISLVEKRLDQNTLQQQNILDNYQEFVKADTTLAGALSISVLHPDAALAAKYANAIMEETRSLVESEDEVSKEKRLSYLSLTLADALEDMEESQLALKDFALKNSALAQDSFMSGTVKLDDLRMERKEAKEIASILNKLYSLVQNGNTDDQSYQSIRSKYPIVDDVSFRRILGMSETISAWAWPSEATLLAVSTTLFDRIQRLNVEISDMEEEATVYASSAEKLARLTRNAKIAEATYKVLIEQVKSQSLVAGFKTDTFKVYQYASPPVKPSEPKRILILALSLILGLVIGSALAIVNMFWKNVYYTRRAMVLDNADSEVIKSNNFRKLSKKSIYEIKEYLNKRSVIDLEETLIRLSEKKIVYVVNLGGRSSASGICRILATKSAMTGRSVVLCDITGFSSKEGIFGKTKVISGVSYGETDFGLDVMQPNEKSSNFFSSYEFKNNLNGLLSLYDQIYICGNRKESSIGLKALEPYKASLVVLSRLRKTLKSEIRRVRIADPKGILIDD